MFSFLQIKHNKNSVKPICSICLTNYKNFISIRIENNGTGPLIIMKDGIRFVQSYKREEVKFSIIDLLEPEFPQILKVPVHRVYPRANALLSIPASEKKYLLSITLDNDKERKSLRKILKSTEITVEYTDIYGTKFESVTRILDLFSKDYGITITDVEKYNLWD